MSTSPMLGEMMLFTIRDNILVPHDELIAEWKRLNLPMQYAPTKRNVTDAFRKATPKTRIASNYVLRKYTGAHRIKPGQSSMETVLTYSKDHTSKVDIEHVNCAVIYLEDKNFAFQPYYPLDETEIELINMVRRRFHEIYNFVDSSQLRNSVHKVLKHISTLAYRTGAYLVPGPHVATGHALVQLLRFCSQFTSEKSGTTVWTIPYPDSVEMRTQLQTVLDSHLHAEGQALITMANSYEFKPVTNIRRRSRDTTLRDEMAQLLEVVKLYEQLLGTTLTGARATQYYYSRQLHQTIADRKLETARNVA